MKELILLRHAKSSWDNDLDDRNRPLTEKGVNRIINISKASRNFFLDIDTQKCRFFPFHILKFFFYEKSFYKDPLS